MSEGKNTRRALTGIGGLDELLGGGLPRGKIILVCGGPGSGKTTLATQFLYNGVRDYDETGVLVTFAESPDSIRENMSNRGLSLKELESKEKLKIIDLSRVLYLDPEDFHRNIASGVRVHEFNIENAVVLLKKYVADLGAKRIVIDSITSLSLHEQEWQKRRNVSHLFRCLFETGCTCVVTLEIRATTLEREFQIEEYLTEGVVLMQTMIKDNQLKRAISIEKMRGIAHDTQPRPYYLTEKGLEVFPQETVI